MGGGRTSDIIDEYSHPRDIAERFADIFKRACLPNSGPKISQNVNYTHRRTMHGGAKRRSAEGVGSGEGRRSHSQYVSLGALAPENFEI